MSELTADFQSLPAEYQHVLQMAQEQHQVQIAPLQTLVGGWSGAFVFLVSISSQQTGRVEHCILKLDHKGKSAKSDEVSRHTSVVSRSSSEFIRNHIAELVFDRVEAEGAIAIFYRIAGQSLLQYRPLSSYGQTSQLKSIFTETNQVLLEEWNSSPTFRQALHPQKVLETWLGFRLDAGGNIERFLQATCRVHPDTAGFLINENIYPNPLFFARKPDVWGKARPMDILTGLIHGDLNANNILVKFSEDHAHIEGYYLIDFALFKDGMPLLYDQRYLEISYFILTLSQISFAKCVHFLTHLAEADIPASQSVSVEMSGVSEVISSARSEFGRWVTQHHPSLQDDLWGQYWLAGVAAGLSYCHKAGLSDEQRLTGLIYAAANLKRYFATFSLPLPADVVHLYSDGRIGTVSQTKALAGTPHHSLPVEPTPFIGRAAHIAALKELMLDPQVRLVTLIGPGGTGKTRLSLQVAREMGDRFPHGVFFVPLADDTDINQLVSRIAQQLEVREGGRPLLENIKDYVRDKNILLVLDNFEQLVSAASAVAELLAAAPQLKVITSSRIPLKLRGEREFPVPPLDIPRASEELSIADLAGNESIRLFVERAGAVQPSFALTKDNASVIVEICRRLDGLPLAIELAAARIKLLNPQAILTRLDDRFKLLTGGARDLPSRQQTLRNTLEWSYGLLHEEEKKLFTRLGVFVGGFSIEAAEEVCNWEGSLDILEGVSALVDNSLVRQEETPEGEPRFGMLETIRAYALASLAARGEMETVQARHAAYFGDVIIHQMGLELYTRRALYWLNWLERENDNIRATLTWCLASPQGIEMGAALIFVLFWFWYRRGYAIEGRMWTDRFLASPVLQAPTPLRVSVLSASGMLSLWHGEQETALVRLQESLKIEYQVEDDLLLGLLFMANGIAYINMGKDDSARPLLEHARMILQELEIAPLLATATVHLGNIELGLGNPEKAHALHEEALKIARSVGEEWLITFALNNLGEVARVQGHYDLARKYYEECITMLSDTGDQGDLARFVHNLGYIAQHEGDYTRAESQFRQSLTMFRRLGNRRGMAECMAGLAGLRARQGEAEWGAVMLSAAESVLRVTGGEWWPADRVEVDANQEVLRSALSGAALAAAQAKGQAMDLERALAFASTLPG